MENNQKEQELTYYFQTCYLSLKFTKLKYNYHTILLLLKYASYIIFTIVLFVNRYYLNNKNNHSNSLNVLTYICFSIYTIIIAGYSLIIYIKINFFGFGVKITKQIETLLGLIDSLSICIINIIHFLLLIVIMINNLNYNEIKTDIYIMTETMSIIIYVMLLNILSTSILYKFCKFNIQVLLLILNLIISLVITIILNTSNISYATTILYMNAFIICVLFNNTSHNNKLIKTLITNNYLLKERDYNKLIVNLPFSYAIIDQFTNKILIKNNIFNENFSCLVKNHVRKHFIDIPNIKNNTNFKNNINIISESIVRLKDKISDKTLTKASLSSTFNEQLEDGDYFLLEKLITKDNKSLLISIQEEALKQINSKIKQDHFIFLDLFKNLANKKEFNVYIKVSNALISTSKNNVELMLIENKLNAIEKERIETEKKIKNLLLSKISHEFKTPTINIQNITEKILIDTQLSKGTINFSNNPLLFSIYQDLKKIKYLSEIILILISDLGDYINNDISNEITHKETNNHDEKQITIYKQNSILKIKSLKDYIIQLCMNLLDVHCKSNFCVVINIADKINNKKIILDDKKLKQIICNLLSNAIKNTDKGGLKISFLEESKKLNFNSTKNTYVIRKQSSNLLTNNNKIQICCLDSILDDRGKSDKNSFNRLSNQYGNEPNNKKKSVKTSTDFLMQQIKTIKEEDQDENSSQSNIKLFSSRGKSIKSEEEQIEENIKNINEENNLFIIIEDTGCGLSGDLVEKINDSSSFLNYDHKLNTCINEYSNNKGIGIGLIICKRLCKEIGVLLSCESKLKTEEKSKAKNNNSTSELFRVVNPVNKLSSISNINIKQNQNERKKPYSSKCLINNTSLTKNFIFNHFEDNGTKFILQFKNLIYEDKNNILSDEETSSFVKEEDDKSSVKSEHSKNSGLNKGRDDVVQRNQLNNNEIIDDSSMINEDSKQNDMELTEENTIRDSKNGIIDLKLPTSERAKISFESNNSNDSIDDKKFNVIKRKSISCNSKGDLNNLYKLKHKSISVARNNHNNSTNVNIKDELS